MKAYSLDLRERVVAAYEAGWGTRAEVADTFGVSDSFLKKMLRKKRTAGTLAPRPHGGGRRPIFDGERREDLRRAVKDHPDALLRELPEITGVPASPSVVHNTLARLGVHRKKRASGRRNRTGRT